MICQELLVESPLCIVDQKGRGIALIAPCAGIQCLLLTIHSNTKFGIHTFQNEVNEIFLAPVLHHCRWPFILWMTCLSSTLNYNFLAL
jgi:hypothetical protein